MNNRLIFSVLIAGIVGTGFAGNTQAAVQAGNYQSHVQADTTRIDPEPRRDMPAFRAAPERMTSTRGQLASYQDGVQPAATRQDPRVAPNTHQNDVAVRRSR